MTPSRPILTTPYGSGVAAGDDAVFTVTAVGDRENTSVGDDVAVFLVELEHALVVGRQKRVTVGKEKRVAEPAAQEAEAAAGAQGLVLVVPGDVVVGLVLREVGLHEVLLVIDDDVEVVAAVGLVFPHDELDDGVIAHGDERLGEDARERVQPGAFAARVDHDRDAQLFAVPDLAVSAAVERNDCAGIVDDGDYDVVFAVIEALGLLQGLCDLGTAVAGAHSGVLHGAAGQEEPADVSVCDAADQDVIFVGQKENSRRADVDLLHGLGYG